MNQKVRTITLEEVCKKLLDYQLYDFSQPLQVCYRMQDPDLLDSLLGYCHVTKKMSGFSVDSDDGDTYSMSDEVILWGFHKEDREKQPILYVWIPTEWLEG